MQLRSNKLKSCLSAGLLALTACAALGAEPMTPYSHDLYRAGEMDLDAFGSASILANTPSITCRKRASGITPDWARVSD